VRLKRFAAPRLVFNFGITKYSALIDLRSAQVHVPLHE
jgi:hypothetical protein